MGRHLILVGGGHAHLTTIVKIRDFIHLGHRVTLIGPSPYHYYSGMGPGALGGFYRPEEIRFSIQEMGKSRGAHFIKDRVIRIDPKEQALILESGNTIKYDVVSFNIGSGVPWEVAPPSRDNILTVKPVENLLTGKHAILELLRKGKGGITVVGGGPAALEIAGNIAKLVRNHGGDAHITLLAGNVFLSRFPKRVRRLAMRSLVSSGIDIIEGSKVKKVKGNEAILQDDRSFGHHLCFIAVGITPPDVFVKSGLPIGPDGGMLVNAFLRCTEYPNIFGGGDCISFQPRPLDKVGVYAVRQNMVLYRNLLSALENRELEKFNPAGKYLLIFNLGDGKAISFRAPFIFNGRTSFILKNYIDRKFMKRFQIP
jgi:NADH dehydrogenase FAD-containing subunit